MPDQQEHSHLLFQDLVTRADAQRDKKEAPSISVLAEALDDVFFNLGDIEIKYDDDEDEAFVIEVQMRGKLDALHSQARNIFQGTGSDKSLLVKRGVYRPSPTKAKAVVFHVLKTELLPEFKISVTFGKSFNAVSDLPRLVREIQGVHNEKMKEFDQTQEPMVFINTSRRLADFWKFMSQKIAIFAFNYSKEINQIEDSGKQIGKDQIGEALSSYAKLCQIIALGFYEGEEDELSEMAQQVDSSSAFEFEWKEIEQNLVNIIEQIKRNQKKRIESVHSIDFESLIARFLRIITAKTQEEILNKLNFQARLVFFQQAQAELFRKAGLGFLVDNISEEEDVGDVAEMNQQINLAIMIRDNFPYRQRQLDDLSEQLSKNKINLDQARRMDDVVAIENLISQRTEYQKILARQICAIVYSQKFHYYMKEKYTNKELILYHHANCVSRSEIIYQLWLKYCGENSLSALTRGHIFSVVRLANGSMLKLEVYPKDFNPDANNKNPIHDFGDHSIIYQAAILDTEAHRIGNFGNIARAISLSREAVRLLPNNPGFLNHLAWLLSKSGDNLDEAEIIYRKAVDIDPEYSECKINLALFLFIKRNKFSEAVKIIEELIKREPDNPSYITYLGVCYYNHGDYERAIELFSHAKNIMIKNPELENFASVYKLDSWITQSELKLIRRIL